MKRICILYFFCLVFSVCLAVAQDNSDGLLISEARVAIDKYKDYDAGIKALKRVSQEGQKHVFYDYYMAQAYEGLKDDAKALYHYQQYASRATLTPQLMDHIAELKYKVNKMTDQENDSKSSSDYFTYTSEASSKFENGEIEQGIYYVEKAIATGKAKANDYLDLALAYAFQNKPDQVIRQLQQYSQKEEASYKEILGRYLFVKYFNKPYFQNYLHTTYGSDAMVALQDILQQFELRKGRYAPSIYSGYGNDYGEISDKNGFISVDFDSELNFILSGKFSYRYKYKSRNEFADGSLINPYYNTFRGRVEGNIQGYDFNNLKEQMKKQKYLNFSTGQYLGYFGGVGNFDHLDKSTTETFSLGQDDNGQLRLSMFSVIS